MKFFNLNTRTPESNCQPESWAYPCDARDILEPFHRSSYQYSTHHSQLPKSAVPSNVSSASEILVVSDANCVLSIALPNYSHSKMVDIRCADEHDLCSQHLSEFLHYPSCKPELSNLYNGLEYPLPAHGSDISLSKPSEHSDELHYENYVDIHSQVQRYEKFIETKSSRTKSAGF